MSTPPFLRQRNTPAKPSTPEQTLANAAHDTNKPDPATPEIVWGKTPSGEVFRIPATHDVLTSLFHPAYPKSHLDLINLGLLSLQIILFLVLPRNVSKIFFMLYFAFWRASYDAGLGWVLTQQSKKKWIVRQVQRTGWLDENRRPLVRNWIKKQLVGKMGKDYSFDELPVEYNTWLLFRQAVDVILLNDFLAYCLFAFAHFRVPSDLSVGVHILRWIGGIGLIVFNLWVKTEAHNVIKDYAWYWGDVFFHQFSHLIFDGVFELAPHPMYSVGYAGYYGLSLIVGSYPVLFVSLAGHAAQFAFLVFFENPHIERRYGERKPISQRTPLSNVTRNQSQATLFQAQAPENQIPPTPGITEGESASETDFETTDTETEMDHQSGFSPPDGNGTGHGYASSKSRPLSMSTTTSHSSKDKRNASPRPLSQHDLLNKYFRRDAILLRNLDLFRTSDFMLTLLLFYTVLATMLPPLTGSAALALHFVHAAGWCLFHCFGLGLLLQAQSKNKFLVRHFMKNYHYQQNLGRSGAVQEAFSNWKSLYNLSLCMTYISSLGLAWKTYHLPNEWTVGTQLFRHTLGIVLIALHVWAAVEAYEALGIFGWFFGDFFMDDFPAHLQYSGIYRYLNNPEVMSGAAFLGLALISNSKLVLTVTIIRYLSNWWFLSQVEKPHMRKLYGDSLRKEAGFVKVIKNVANKNAKILESTAGKHGPHIKRVAREVTGTFGKVYDETAEAVEEFLSKTQTKRRLSEVVHDTKVLLQQSRERMIITRVANDISKFDTSKYRLTVMSVAAGGSSRFQLGEPIKLLWKAPKLHSRRDWIGIYRVGANTSNLVTKISSLGLWVPVHDEEWDGDIPLGLLERPTALDEESEKGEVIFKGDQLPWTVGKYEVRYHHDGKYNVMALDGPIEIFIDVPNTMDFDAVRAWLMRVVPLCLDMDPSLIPLVCQSGSPATDDGRDPDDFSFWSERQAKRISNAIKQGLDVDYSPELVVADANLTVLANRIIASKDI